MNRSIRATRKTSPKVVSIPVHFVGSEEPSNPTARSLTPAAAAVKLQKVVRGFLVRKSVKKITSIRNEVDEIERRISRIAVVELLIKDAKERIRVNESLMALLFKLDSVRGVDSGVRDLRKSVIKKAIALQEKVDGIVAGEYQNLGPASNDSTVMEVQDSVDCLINSESPLDQTVESEDKAADQTVESKDEAADQTVDTVNCDSDVGSEQIKEAVAVEKEPNHDEIMPNIEEITAAEGVLQFEAESEDCAVKEIDQNCDIVKDVSECLDESVETSYTEEYNEQNSPNSQSLTEEGEDNYTKQGVDETKIEVEDGDGEDNKRNRDMLEKMMEENEKMMKMMQQMFERNEEQTRMLNGLSRRDATDVRAKRRADKNVEWVES